MRFECIYDEGDWILDHETGAYMDMEEACQKLNELDGSMGVVASFLDSVKRGLDEANKEVEED